MDVAIARLKWKTNAVNLEEKKTQNDIIRTFSTRSDMRLWRANSGVAKFEDERTGKERQVRFGIPGQADLSGIVEDGVRLEIEVKSKTGKQTIAQKNFQNMIDDFGGIYILARSVQDVTNELRKRGYDIKI